VKKLRQTNRTEHAIVVLGNAFTAEKIPAFRATRHGFARGMT
jgi:hypothetical protein